MAQSVVPNRTLGQRLKDFPDYGAYLLALAWLVFRVISISAALLVIGALSYTASAFDHTGIEPPLLLVEGIVMASAATICSITATFFWYHKADRGLLVILVFDIAFFGIFCHLSSALSEPAVFPQCSMSDATHPDAAATTTSANVFAGDMWSKLARRDQSSGFANFIEANHIPCAAVLAFWVPCIALSAAFFCAAVLDPVLWSQCRKAYPPRGCANTSRKGQTTEEMGYLNAR